MKHPEEVVRQEFIYRLHTQWGYPLAQMRQEARTQRGRGSTRADIVVSESIADAAANRAWLLVVETKAENVPIVADDYGQGESYARAVGAEFLVMHNQKETSFFRLIPGAPGERIEITGIPKAGELGDTKRLEEIRRATKTFTRDEFQRLLFECHSILRDNHKMDPGAAFDEISKILFIKMAYERQGHSEVFTTERLRTIAAASLVGPDDDALLEQLFESTKKHYKADQLFGENEGLKVSLATFRRIVSKLETFNLSDTGDDVKGIAFEKFLGDTFRGQLGQFFTPRPIVDFMVELLDPKEGQLTCDPASGTGGFLIKVFEYVRSQIERDVQAQKALAIQQARKEAKKTKLPEEELADKLEKIQTSLNQELDVTHPNSRIYNVAHNCIFGADAEPRAARTSKMNMIMHGDGHGGIHYHDGLLDVNGIFEDRFDIVLTNPPFGSNVGRDQLIGSTEQTRVEDNEELLRMYKKRYGASWAQAHEAMVAAASERRPILQQFDIGRDPIGPLSASSKIRANRPTEQLFIERCLSLLRPGGRLGIVLPDGILNNPSLGWLRDYIEGRAKLLAVISVPQEVFASSRASVKTSLVFLQRFTEQQSTDWTSALHKADVEVREELGAEWKSLVDLERRAETYDRPDLADQVDAIRALEQATPKDEYTLQTARRALNKVLTATDKVAAKVLAAEAKKQRRVLEAAHTARVRARTRELTTYPVFMADVEAAGITSTGDTGPNVPNELPSVVADYRRFEADPDRFAEHMAERLEEELFSSGSEPPES